ncbi:MULTISPECIES: DUF1249 domain-containing protein [unclassified Oceanobacter]|jgi:uncharacterized protein YqiB (DUF1249 family)|nr:MULTISPECIES: DUF1249 domain-containing protein [unclassified Oceanobacter]MDO6680912.1 DUF1249 domain-containing protein [Oceanobacter sp. 5_MG-2023]MDP2504673.1 DUF1249 domain-containing protein [Oceanobacter sp. 3_MG-2023]MDP2607696.1 DUF1249 domain-containing protein [Oceanobacter sp. 1_MG-2023]MDP2611120.1 DUF1249 domain-containing protein [Oceanobacter sp. 2_MG-2023]
MNNRIRQRYIPDLTVLSSLGQANYARLQKLVTDHTVGVEHAYSMSNGSQPASRISVKIEENHRYTTMLKVSQMDEAKRWVAPPVMTVRMYHDVCMAEVIGYQNERVGEGRYDYPNDQMRLPDEKTQLNRFLADWLEHCMKFGHIDQSVALSSGSHSPADGV